MKRLMWVIVWVIVLAEVFVLTSTALANPAMMLDLLYWIRR